MHAMIHIATPGLEKLIPALFHHVFSFVAIQKIYFVLYGHRRVSSLRHEKLDLITSQVLNNMHVQVTYGREHLVWIWCVSIMSDVQLIVWIINITVG